MIDIITAMEDPELFGKTFNKRRLLGGDSWASWKVFLRALFGLSLSDEARAIYQRHTGRSDEPVSQFRESFVVVGRRGGKSIISALAATFVACFRDYTDTIAPGETGVVMIIAADRRQARVILGYINGFVESIPMLSRMVVSRLKESLVLTNGIVIEIHTSSFRATRGFTICAAICNELAFWPTDESANPDVEVLNALRPGMATIPNALLLAISSPYAKRGALWEAYREHYGKEDSDVLIWQSDSRSMNPTLSAVTVATAYLRDRAAASAEFGAQFRDDVQTFISVEVVESRVIPQRFELPPNSAHTYCGFVDPSGGRSDSMTLGLAHMEGDNAVLDLVREVVPPFSPESVCQEFAATLRSYRISEATADAYSGEWAAEGFRKHGISLRTSELTRSELYLELLPMLMSGRCELLDSKRLTMQLVGLERRTARGGRDSVDHGPGSHDDVANAAAGAIVFAHGNASAHVYGLLGIHQRVQSGELVLSRGIVLEAAEQEISRGTWKEPTPPVCAQCGSTCVIRIGGVGLQCNQCQYVDPTGLPETQRVTKADVLSGRKFQSRIRRLR